MTSYYIGGVNVDYTYHGGSIGDQGVYSRLNF